MFPIMVEYTKPDEVRVIRKLKARDGIFGVMADDGAVSRAVVYLQIDAFMPGALHLKSMDDPHEMLTFMALTPAAAKEYGQGLIDAADRASKAGPSR